MAALLPYAVSSNSSTWRVEEGGWGMTTHAVVLNRDQHTCRFCAFQAPCGLGVLRPDAMARSDGFGDLVTACLLCWSAQRPGRPSADQEIVFIWLPEVTQAALIQLVRGIHLSLAAKGQSARASGTGTPADGQTLAARSVYDALLARKAGVEARLGASRPSILAPALRARRPHAGRSGLRALPLGRIFQGGLDVYPVTLTSWLQAT